MELPRRWKKHNKLTNGEICTLAAIAFSIDPGDVEHCIMIITHKDAKIGVVTTECPIHTAGLLLEALDTLNHGTSEEISPESGT